MHPPLPIGALAGMIWRVGIAFVLLALLAAGVARGAGQAGGPTPPGAEWEEVIKPLRSMPVQDFGFIRSGWTFGENHLMAIAGKRSWQGRSPLLVCLWLMSDDAVRHDIPLIKVMRPELVKLFGGSRISLAQYHDQAKQDQFMALIQSDQEKWTKPANELHGKAMHLEELAEDFAIVPRSSPESKEWLSPVELRRALQSGSPPELGPRDEAILEAWESLMKAFRDNDRQAGGAAAARLAAEVEGAARELGVDLSKMKIDVLYHSHHPFGKSAVFFLLAAVLYGASFITMRPRLAWGGWALLLVGFAEALLGVVARWILAGRAPLSNMYESFTFAITGMVLVALVFELVTRAKVAGFGSAVLGFVFMVLAHKAPIFDSQIRPLMPALQSSWLTYHVVTIMLSYSAFALSFFVSVAYLAKDFLGGDRVALLRRLPSLEVMDVFNYKIIAVGFPLLTLGIILGAVWAATAWGRPWGFDPKETWSAITWLVYAIYLHVRYLAGWKGRRAALMAILGFGCVLFTYLGVNYLLPGLHSYV
ncbi:MAG: hypothetical protein Kow0059_21580 [Candidatus Sumerlaeia bacterium]